MGFEEGALPFSQEDPKGKRLLGSAILIFFESDSGNRRQSQTFGPPWTMQAIYLS